MQQEFRVRNQDIVNPVNQTTKVLRKLAKYEMITCL